MQPDHLLSRFNLGIAHEGLGGPRRRPWSLPGRALRIAPREEKAALTVSELLLKAQALARLGQPVQAVGVTMKALGEGDRNSQVVYQAAIIYALCGDQNHAIVQAREARKRGLSPRWFSIPGFESLRATPAFQENPRARLVATGGLRSSAPRPSSCARGCSTGRPASWWRPAPTAARSRRSSPRRKHPCPPRP